MKFKILSYMFDLDFEKGFRQNLKNNNINRDGGNIDYRNQTIKVDGDDKEKEQILIHEVIHAISYFWSIKLDESDVERLSEGLYHILKENKLLNFNQLFEKEEL